MLDTVLSVHLWRSSLAVGSTSTQLINMDNHDRRRTIVDTSMEVEDEDLEVCVCVCVCVCVQTSGQ